MEFNEVENLKECYDYAKNKLANETGDSKKEELRKRYDLVFSYKDSISSYFTDNIYSAWIERNPDFKAIVKATDFSGINSSEDECTQVKTILNYLFDYLKDYIAAQPFTKDELKPNAKIVKEYVNAFCEKDKPRYKDIPYIYHKEYEHYQKQFKVIELMMKLTMNINEDDPDFEYATIMKAALLNALYSTNIRNIHPVVHQILKIENFKDSVISSGARSFVDFIRKAPGTDDVYSFATKYCHIHNPEYPIYDKFVAGMLIFFHYKYWKENRPSLQNVKLTNASSKIYIKEIIPTGFPDKKPKKGDLLEILSDYSKYVESIDNFKKAYDLRPLPNGDYFNYSELDNYLWGLGRKHDVTPQTVLSKLKDMKIL